MSRDPLAAYDTAPSVSVVENEIVVLGDGVTAAYTPDAAREMAHRVLRAVDEVDGARDSALRQAAKSWV